MLLVIRLLVALVLAVAVTGCGRSGPRDPVVGHPGTPPSAGRFVLTVHTTTAPDAPLFTEGFVPEIRLVAADGSTLMPEEDHVDRAVFTHLTAGTYVLQAAERPCDANCGVLDPAQDRCRQRLRVSADTEALVVYRPGQPCRVTAPR